MGREIWYIRHTTTDVNITRQAMYVVQNKIEPHSCTTVAVEKQ